jgi:hypothetical protein
MAANPSASVFAPPSSWQAYADTLARAAVTANAAVSAATGRSIPTAAGGGGRAPVLAVPAVTVLPPMQVAKQLLQWAHDEEVVDALYLQVRLGGCLAALFRCFML